MALQAANECGKPLSIDRAVAERFAKLVAEECCRVNEACLEQGFLNPSSIIRSRFGLT
jgi:hypothetical protein